MQKQNDIVYLLLAEV